MGGFARIGNNEISVLVNDAEKGSDIDPQEAQQTFKIAQANLRKAEGKSCIFVTNRSMEEIRLPALEMRTYNKIKMEYLQMRESEGLLSILHIGLKIFENVDSSSSFPCYRSIQFKYCTSIQTPILFVISKIKSAAQNRQIRWPFMKDYGHQIRS
ncbi:ATP synthase epsilon chain [Forsythia ovata]|uniref:ATP synthase epsilon chain n=1 Tax=Forsythia ovata TaxID=205694 RepID=A0ABD1WI91_9LAMI